MLRIEVVPEVGDGLGGGVLVGVDTLEVVENESSFGHLGEGILGDLLGGVVLIGVVGSWLSGGLLLFLLLGLLLLLLVLLLALILGQGLAVLGRKLLEFVLWKRRE